MFKNQEITIDYLSGSSAIQGGRRLRVTTGDVGLIPVSERSPGEGNADHSSILAWKIPRTEEPGGLQSMGLQRVRHD